MVDTILFYSQDFKINDNGSLRITPNDIDYRTGESLGNKILFNEVTGKYARLTLKEYQLAIRNKTGIPYLVIQSSLPKLIHGRNVFTITGREFKESIRLLDTDLKQRGIYFNIYDSLISRLDITRNANIENPFRDYMPIFKVLELVRRTKKEIGTTFQYENTQEEFVIYDKIEEMKHNGVDTSDLPKNILRSEYRMIKARKVKSTLGFYITNELIKNYDILENVYNLKMEKNIFKLKEMDFLHIEKQGTWNELLSKFNEYVKDKSMNTKTKNSFMRYVGEKYLIKRYGLENVLDLMTYGSSYANDKSLKTFERKKRKELQQIQIEMEFEENKTLWQLYKEIENKLLGKVA